MLCARWACAGLITMFAISAAADSVKLKWRVWDPSIFVAAKKEKKLVLLDLQAVWCHWCHVMEEKTYSDRGVIDEITKDYIIVQADQDASPELARTYEDFGWPATIVFDAEGHELLKRAGYIEAKEMKDLLIQLRAHPEPLKDETFVLEPVTDLEKYARDVQTSAYDEAKGGWKGSHKYLDRDFIIEQAVREAAGDKVASTRRVKTLDGVRKILDPVWGGLYQYSVERDWNEPHYEKLATYQADAIMAFSVSYAYAKDPRDLAAAKQTAAYVERFLTAPDGTFYTSQDADSHPGESSEGYFKLNDQERVAKGVPRVDQHVYPRETGLLIEAFVKLSEVSGDQAYLEHAVRAAKAVIEKLTPLSGGYSHGADSVGALSLADQVAMGRAFLALYEATGDRAWLAHAQTCSDVIAKRFAPKSGGYLAFEATGILKPKALAEENFALARFENALYQASGVEMNHEMAKRAFDFASHDEGRDRPYLVSLMLLAQHEVSHDPLHVTIVGAKTDAAAKALYAAALGYPEVYRRVEWFDRKEGPPARADVTYPELKKPAAFICTGKLCSTPTFEADKLADQIRRVLKVKR